ncbi:MAG: SDR family NAD(P)-dependent oxidoreductase [Bacteroidales bacterium]|jgi:short-subunit dehydrogenase|nr:SDR family NAD(P)-dependent oxidoreductase [Bacteroidales bacterium]MDD3330357.1 SDR family NAD(P)-dependent oxidoreductase [Bacteroidales bacterium]MDD3690763.1 SDR family NAD(P)-dependent oxidoreductase [Bacteroidales bacterium]MDD4044298.1 SDR family NAD(P)-dependent oxidoreductase [Bacteroidales bacterium]MDD4581153.1 SDR family NAD(P)-dependent oxidoreductase [Bacteroidales bacterium]
MQSTISYALITGGSSGIGLAFASELAKRNYAIVIVSNQEEKNREVCQQLEETYHVKAISLYIDLTLPHAVQSVYDFCMENKLNIEILINNAGMFFFKEIAETSDELVHKITQLHVSTPTLLSVYFSKYMKEKQSGHILFISSITAWMSFPGIVLYASTKGYIRQFARSLRYEMNDYHVNVTVVCPGAVNTDLYQLSDKQRKMFQRLQLMVSPEYLAKKTIQALFRKKAVYIPGLLNKLSRPFIAIILPCLIQKIKQMIWKKMF